MLLLLGNEGASRDPGQSTGTRPSMKRVAWSVELRPGHCWAVQRDGTKRADSRHPKKPTAIAHAVELGKKASPIGQLRIKDERGKIVEERDEAGLVTEAVGVVD
jgi:hypothetical protein